MFGAFYLQRLGVKVDFDPNVNIKKSIEERCSKPFTKNIFYTSLVIDRTMLFDFDKCGEK